MFQSSTVENYLKAIYQGQLKLADGARLVPMGQVASALGVAPGTATTMVKALARAGPWGVQPLRRRPPLGSRREARGSRAPPPSPRRAVPGAGDGYELGGSA